MSSGFTTYALLPLGNCWVYRSENSGEKRGGGFGNADGSGINSPSGPCCMPIEPRIFWSCPAGPEKRSDGLKVGVVEKSRPNCCCAASMGALLNGTASVLLTVRGLLIHELAVASAVGPSGLGSC